MRGEETREKIMEAALKVIYNETIEGLSTRKVSGVANVNLAAIHYHHRSKDGMLIDLSRYVLNNYVTPEVFEGLEASKESVEVIETLLKRVFALYKKRPDAIVTAIYLWLQGLRSRRIKDIFKSFRSDKLLQLEEVLAASMSKRRARRVAERALTYISGWLLETVVEEVIPDQAMIEEAARLLV
ncbi:MAG TPA: TetR/AcrR family transcriptional regulator [Kosmotogaceae bacterium]|nr:TetR/AcrR family transcriptional regulator [Kosmotogaceae bacterium]